MKLLILALLLAPAQAAAEAPLGSDGQVVQLGPTEEDTSPTAVQNPSNSSGSCPTGWSEFNGRCFRYFPVPTKWALAQTNCVLLQASLASVHSADEYQEIQRLIMAAANEDEGAWIGGSDAQEEGTWLWMDGSLFDYSNWCKGEPNNGAGNAVQHCLLINYRAEKCWDDLSCNALLPFVCAKKISSCAH